MKLNSYTLRSGTFIFLVNRIFNRIAIPNHNMFKDELSKFFLGLVKDKKVLEFGCGYSTIFFAENCKFVISVESDRYFLRKVKSLLLKRGLKDRAHVFFANIGPTKSYGQPWNATKRCFSHRYSNYSCGVFTKFKHMENVDIVFVDGRFRVACAMASLLNIKKDFILVVDDFIDRIYYSPITKVLGIPQEIITGSAIFNVNLDAIDFRLVREYLNLYLLDKR